MGQLSGPWPPRSPLDPPLQLPPRCLHQLTFVPLLHKTESQSAHRTTVSEWQQERSLPSPIKSGRVTWSYFQKQYSVWQVEHIMLVFLWCICVLAQYNLIPQAVMIVLYPNPNLILSFPRRSDQNIPALLVKKCFWSASSGEPNLFQQQLTVSFVSFGRANRVAVNQSQMVILLNIHLKMSQSFQDFKYFLH